MNSLFTSLYDEIVNLTQRADLVSETKFAIREATTYFHHLDFFPQDLVEESISSDGVSYLVTIDLTTLTRFRKLAYIRLYDISTGEVLPNFVEMLPPDRVLDSYKLDKIDVAYQAGTSLNVKMGVPATGLIISYYKNPILDENNYDSWVASRYPIQILTRAITTLFTMIGYVEEANKYSKLLMGDGRQAGLTQQFIADNLSGAAI